LIFLIISAIHFIEHYLNPTGSSRVEISTAQDDSGTVAMIKHLMSLFITTLLLLIIILGKPTSLVAAQDILQIQAPQPLFSSDTVWLPGDTHINSFLVSNSDSQTHQLAIQAVNYQDTGNLDQVMEIQFFNQLNSIYGPRSLADFWNSNEVFLLNIAQNQTVQIDIQINFLATADNQYQN